LLGEATLLLDIEDTTCKGKEIPTTRALLDRAYNEYGEGFVDIILLDALYADKQMINQILSHKSHFLMKTEETSLTIIQDADSLFKCWKTQYTHDEHSFEALMLLMFIDWNLLLLFNLEDIKDIRK